MPRYKISCLPMPMEMIISAPNPIAAIEKFNNLLVPEVHSVVKITEGGKMLKQPKGDFRV